MMRGGEVLLALAQIAIAQAGFSGVVAAFGRGGGFRVEDRVRFLILVGSAFIGILLSLFPFLLDLGGMGEPAVWRWSSAAGLLAYAVASPLVAWGRRVIIRTGKPAPGWSISLVVSIAVLAGVAQAGNIVGWPYEPGPVPFILLLMAGMLASGAIFVYLVLITPTPSRGDEPPRA